MRRIFNLFKRKPYIEIDEVEDACYYIRDRNKVVKANIDLLMEIEKFKKKIYTLEIDNEIELNKINEENRVITENLRKEIEVLTRLLDVEIDSHNETKNQLKLYTSAHNINVKEDE